jgi:predicted dehydrogenase
VTFSLRFGTTRQYFAEHPMSNTTTNQPTPPAPLRIGVVGMGARSWAFLPYFQRHRNDGEIVALCDRVIDKARYMAEFAKLTVPTYDALQTMIDRERLDALIVATPDFAHVEPVTAALAAGIHVYCEKPLATTLADCDAITRSAQTSKAILYIGFNLRHGPFHRTIHEIVSRGQLGRITTIEANEWYYGGKTYFRRWNRLQKFGGGLWITKACHDFDLLNWIANAEPISVAASAALSHYGPKADAGKQCRSCPLKRTCPDYYDVFNTQPDDYLSALRRISERHGGEPGDLCLYNAEKDTFDNGIAMVNYANDVRATYTVNVLAARTTRQMRIIGSEGTLEGDMEKGWITVTERHTERQHTYDLSAMMRSGHGGADDRVLADFVNCVHQGRKPITGWREGRKTVAVALAAQQSLETGQIVAVEA